MGEGNEVTWKLASTTEAENTPASHGQWGGYRTSRAYAWVIGLGNGQWLARCGDRASEPCSLNRAKTEAFAMIKGAPGDYIVRNPITHLDGLQARLVDTMEAWEGEKHRVTNERDQERRPPGPRLTR